MSDLTKHKIRKHKMDRAELIKDSKHSMKVSDDILMPIAMNQDYPT